MSIKVVPIDITKLAPKEFSLL